MEKLDNVAIKIGKYWGQLTDKVNEIIEKMNYYEKGMEELKRENIELKFRLSTIERNLNLLGETKFTR